MKLHQKLITLVVVLALALASIGIVAGVQAAGSLETAQISSAPVQVSAVVLPPTRIWTLPPGLKTPPVNMPNVSWNG